MQAAAYREMDKAAKLLAKAQSTNFDAEACALVKKCCCLLAQVTSCGEGEGGPMGIETGQPDENRNELVEHGPHATWVVEADEVIAHLVDIAA